MGSDLEKREARDGRGGAEPLLSVQELLVKGTTIGVLAGMVKWFGEPFEVSRNNYGDYFISCERGVWKLIGRQDPPPPFDQLPLPYEAIPE